jgi:hypothetical protein
MPGQREKEPSGLVWKRDEACSNNGKRSQADSFGKETKHARTMGRGAKRTRLEKRRSMHGQREEEPSGLVWKRDEACWKRSQADSFGKETKHAGRGAKRTRLEKRRSMPGQREEEPSGLVWKRDEACSDNEKRSQADSFGKRDEACPDNGKRSQADSFGKETKHARRGAKRTRLEKRRSMHGQRGEEPSGLVWKRDEACSDNGKRSQVDSFGKEAKHARCFSRKF